MLHGIRFLKEVHVVQNGWLTCKNNGFFIRSISDALGKTVTRAGDFLPETKRRIALGWAAFS